MHNLRTFKRLRPWNQGLTSHCCMTSDTWSESSCVSTYGLCTLACRRISLCCSASGSRILVNNGSGWRFSSRTVHCESQIEPSNHISLLFLQIYRMHMGIWRKNKYIWKVLQVKERIRCELDVSSPLNPVVNVSEASEVWQNKDSCVTVRKRNQKLERETSVTSIMIRSFLVRKIRANRRPSRWRRCSALPVQYVLTDTSW